MPPELRRRRRQVDEQRIHKPVPIDCRVLPPNTELRMPPSLTQDEINQYFAAMQDESGSLMGPLQKALLDKYGGAFVGPDGFTNIGKAGWVFGALHTPEACPKGDQNEYGELIGNENLFGWPSFPKAPDEPRVYPTYRERMEFAFGPKAIAANFMKHLDASLAIVDEASAGPMDLGEFGKRESVSAAAITFGENVDLPQGFVDIAKGILTEFYIARKVPGMPVEYIKGYEHHRDRMFVLMDEIVQKYLKQFKGKLPPEQAQKDALAAIISLFQNEDPKLKMRIITTYHNLLGQFFSTFAGGYDTLGYLTAMSQAAVARQPELLRQMKAEILPVWQAFVQGGKEGNLFQAVRVLPTFREFFTQLVLMYGPSFELYRVAVNDRKIVVDGKEELADKSVLQLGDYRIPSGTPLRLHVSYALAEHYGKKFGDRIDLSKSIGGREGFGPYRRCIGEELSEAKVAGLIVAETIRDVEPVVEGGAEIPELRKATLVFPPKQFMLRASA